MEKKSKGENKPTQNRSRKEQFLWENYIVVYEEKIFALRDVEGNGDCFYSSLLFHPKVRKSFDTVMEIRKFLKEFVTEIYYHNENIRKLFKFEKIGIKTWKKKVIQDERKCRQSLCSGNKKVPPFNVAVSPVTSLIPIKSQSNATCGRSASTRINLHLKL